jgi:hypothetical protein
VVVVYATAAAKPADHAVTTQWSRVDNGVSRRAAKS